MLSNAGLAAVGVYLLSLLGIGAIAKRASREASLRDYYLAGSSLGVTSLFFTLYATQYSGNTLFGVPGLAYREGFSALAITLSVMGIVIVYTVFAPSLNEVSRRQRFVTAGDFVRWRFRDRRLLIAANAIFVITLTGYILANLKAMGLLIEGATGGTVSYALGILLLSLIMAIYESLGGMRSVVWTDVLQGSILLAGSLVIFAIVWRSPALGILSGSELVDSARAMIRQRDKGLEFLSLLVMVSVGAAVYPQAIQRIYAARNASTLRRSYGFLAVMPLLVILPLSLIAMSATRWLPSLDSVESERVILHTIDFALAGTGIWSVVLVLFIGAAVAAVMSTVDSAMLALGSIISNDLLRGTRPEQDEERLHRLSRALSWLLMGAMAILAIVLPQSIWALMVFKFELLIQVAPTIVLGIRVPDLRAASLLAGIAAGCATAIMLKILPGLDAPLGIHAGLWGLGANLASIAIVHSMAARRP